MLFLRPPFSWNNKNPYVAIYGGSSGRFTRLTILQVFILQIVPAVSWSRFSYIAYAVNILTYARKFYAFEHAQYRSWRHQKNAWSEKRFPIIRSSLRSGEKRRTLGSWAQVNSKRSPLSNYFTDQSAGSKFCFDTDVTKIIVGSQKVNLENGKWHK